MPLTAAQGAAKNALFGARYGRHLRPLCLDLFCGAGGAGRGYDLAGFRVVGVDIDPQPNYPYPFLQMDALLALRILLAGNPLALSNGEVITLADIAFVHASPPCQAFSDLQKQNKNIYPDLVAPTRTLLQQTGLIYVIENVEGAPLFNAVKLCGASTWLVQYDLRVIRHRLFESNVPIVGTPCPKKHPLVFTHDKRKNHYGKLDQSTAFVQVTGGGNCRVDVAKRAMGIDWMTKQELNEAIPPAYTIYIGGQVMTYVR